MANWKGHVAGGIVFGAAYAAALSYTPIQQYAEQIHLLNDWQAMAAILVLSTLFALFPDVDTNSKGQNIFYGLALTVDVLLIASGNLQAAAYLGLVAMLPVVGKHRGWTHSKWAMVLIPLPILVVPYLYSQQALNIAAVYYGACVAGYFSHLLLDGLVFKQFRIRN